MKIHVTLAALFFLSTSALAAPGDLDTNFGNAGKKRLDLGFSEAITTGALVQGKIVVAGSADGDFFIARLRGNGELDTTFGEDYNTDLAPDGYSTLALSGQDTIIKLIIDRERYIYAIGNSRSDVDNEYRTVIAKFTPDGALDTTFNNSGTPGYKYYCQKVVLADAAQDTGPTIYMYGTYSELGSTSRGNFSSVGSNSNQIVGCTHNSPSNFTQGDSGDAIGVTLDDLFVVVAGHSGADLYVTRYEGLSNNPDDTFDDDGTAIMSHLAVSGNPATTITVSDLAIDQRSSHDHFKKPVITGSADANFLVTRFTLDGELDSTFSADGIRVIDFGGIDTTRAALIDKKGRTVVAGETDGDIALARLRANGKFDKKFGDNGKLTTLFNENVTVGALLRNKQKKLFVVGCIGSPTNKDILVTRYLGK